MQPELNISPGHNLVPGTVSKWYLIFLFLFLGVDFIQSAPFGGTGNSFWSTGFPVATCAPYHFPPLDVAVSWDNSFVIAWDDESDSPECDGPASEAPDLRPCETEVYCQFFNASGEKKLAEEIRANTVRLLGQDSPSVSLRKDGGCLVVWSGYLHGEDHIQGQWYAPAGAPIGANFTVSKFFDDGWYRNRLSPQLAMNQEGQHVVVWELIGHDRGTAMRVFAPDSTTVRGPCLIAEGEFYPKVAMGPEGTFVVVSYDYSDPIIPMLRRYTNEGVLICHAEPVDSDIYFSGTDCDVGMDGHGNFTVVYTGFTRNANNCDVFAKRFSADGTRLGDRIRINQSTRWREQEPEIAMDSQGRSVVAWLGGGLRIQRFDANGQRVGHDDKIAHLAEKVEVDINDNGRFVVAWEPGSKCYARVFEFDAVDFIRGDANRDGRVDVSDAVGIINYLFAGYQFEHLDAADTNDSGSVDISDIVYLLGHLFTQNPQTLPHPYPHWGFDTTGDQL